MASPGRSITLPNGLTPKQNQFVNHIIKDLAAGKNPNLREAALQAYDTTDRKIATGIASDNMSKPAIRNALADILSSVGLAPSELAPELAMLAKAKPKTISADVKLRTIVEVLKLQEAYPNHKKTETGQSTVINIQNISFSEAKERLKELHSEASLLMEDTD